MSKSKKYQIHLQHPISGYEWRSIVKLVPKKEMEELTSAFRDDTSSFEMEMISGDNVLFSPSVFKELVKTIIEVQ